MSKNRDILIENIKHNIRILEQDGHSKETWQCIHDQVFLLQAFCYTPDEVRVNTALLQRAFEVLDSMPA